MLSVPQAIRLAGVVGVLGAVMALSAQAQVMNAKPPPISRTTLDPSMTYDEAMKAMAARDALRPKAVRPKTKEDAERAPSAGPTSNALQKQ